MKNEEYVRQLLCADFEASSVPKKTEKRADHTCTHEAGIKDTIPTKRKRRPQMLGEEEACRDLQRDGSKSV